MRESPALLAAAVLLIVGLTLPLTTPDEVRYSEVPAEMVAGGDWIVPQLHDRPYLDKPPLHYWLVAASYKLLGLRVGLSRWPSVASAALCALVLYWLGGRLFSRRVALTAATLLLTLPGFQFAAHYANLDLLFTLWTTLCQLALWLGLRDRDRTDYRWVLVAGLSCGLATLTKGPVALVIAMPPLLAWDWLRRQRVRLAAWAAFLTSAALLAVPWFVAIAARQGDFAAHFFIRHHFDRFVGTLEHQRPWWFFLPVLLIGALPLSLLIPNALGCVFRVDARVREQRTGELGVALMAAVWPFVFFSLSSGKLASYVLPALPFVALLFSWYFHLEPEPRSRLRAPHLLLAAFALALVLLTAGPRLAAPFASPWGAGTQFFWILLWLSSLAFCWRMSLSRPAAAILAALLLNAQLLTTALPAMAESRSLLGRAAAHAHRLSNGALLPVVVVAGDEDHVLVRESYPMLVLSLGPDDRTVLANLLEARGQLVLVSEPRHLRWIREDPTYAVNEVDGRGHVFHVVRRETSSRVRAERSSLSIDLPARMHDLGRGRGRPEGLAIPFHLKER